MNTKNPSKKFRNYPVQSRVPNSRAWAYACKLVGPEVRRLMVVKNGAVIIANSDKRPPWLANHML